MKTTAENFGGAAGTVIAAHRQKELTDESAVVPDVFVPSATLTASDAAANDNFGSSAAISGDFAVVGSY